MFLTIPEGIELTIEGEGTLNCYYYEGTSNGVLTVNGSLNLNDITWKVYSQNNQIYGTLTTTNCDITIETQKEGALGIELYGNCEMNGGTLAVNSTTAHTTGIFSVSTSPMQISDCEVTITINAVDSPTSIYGDLYFEDSTVAIDFPDDSTRERIGIYYTDLTFDNTEVSLDSKSGAGALQSSVSSALKIINGSNVIITGTAGNGINITASSEANPASILIDDSTLELKGNGAIGVSLANTASLTGDNYGKVLLAEGSDIYGIGNRFQDRTVVVTNNSYLTVGPAAEEADAQKLSAGTYIWDGSYFSNTATVPTGVTFTAAQVGGESQESSSTGIALTFSQEVTGLTADDITITDGSGSATKGELSGSGTAWVIALSDVETEGTVTVSIRNFNGFRATNSPQTVTVYSANIPADPDQTAVDTLKEALENIPWAMTSNTESDVISEIFGITNDIIVQNAAYADIFIAGGINVSNFTAAALSEAGSFTFTVSLAKNGKSAVTSPINATIFPLDTTPTVTGVIVAPAAVQVKKGTSQLFTAVVTGANNPAQTVTWTLDGSFGASSIDSLSGRLTVGAGETASTLTVKATSTADTTKFITATVSVVDEITTPIYGIAPIDDYNYGQFTEGYSIGGDTSIGIRNTGNQPTGELTASLSNTYWEQDKDTVNSINPGSSKPFYIQPAIGLTAGTYTTTLTITGDNGIRQSTDLSFTVVPWQPPIITFDANGGSVTTLTAQTDSSGMLASLPTPTRSGSYRFDGWFTLATGSIQITTDWVYDEDETLYAHWTYTGGGGGGGNGGGGSSSGGSSGSTTTTTTTTTPGKTPDQPVTATTPVTATAGTNGAASAAIPEKSITDAIAKAQADAKAQGKTANGTTIALHVTMPKGATSLTADLTRNSLNSLVSAGVTSLALNGSPVTVSFDTKALVEIQKQSTGNISITIAPNTSLSASAKAMIGARPLYDLTVNYTEDGKNATVSSFGGGIATVSVPYTPAKGEAIGGLYAVYVDGEGNATRIAGSAYDANSGCVIFTTTHFSLYGIGYTAPSAKFTDITTHWAKESIDYVVGRGLLSGTTDTTFAPDTAMTRGMLVTALGRLANVDTKAYTTNSFTDVKADSAFRPYIEWAYSKGIVQGTGNSKFEPDRAITREEIAVIFANYAKATGYTLPVTRTATTYADASSIGSTYKTAVTAMQQAGIMMGGTNNKFNPQSSATRAEVSSMLHRYIKLTIDPSTAQGWAKNDAGQYLYYKDGKALTGTQTIDGVKYFFETTGVLKTGWVQDGDNWRFYSGNIMLVGFWDLGANGSNKTYYFDTYGNMVSGKWIQIDGKWYYLNADGSLAKSTKIDGYEVDEKGMRKTK